VTGQAAWFDVRVGLRKCSESEAGTWPTFPPLPRTAQPSFIRWGARLLGDGKAA